MFIYMMVIYMIILSMFLMMMFMYFYLNKIVMFCEFELMNLMSLKLELLILIDWVSLLFSSVVLMISSMVLIYSIEYMKVDIKKNRFFMLVFMFVLSMLLMIMSPNLVSILIGWDGLGLVSYCLVIYYQSKSSFNSGMVTVLSNRVGDIMILMSIGLMMSNGSWNLMFLSEINNYILILLIISSFTKSAQLPFSSWLPMAMAAPTPVSSLVHSSTLVTAGVYLIIRLNYFMESGYLMNFIMIISVVTMFLSGLGANIEFDLKKIIALSTLSQLGVMFFCLSLKLEDIALFHLLMHALFKSMLFMCSGVIIHNMLGFQDIRFISMTLYNLPFISLLFNCSSLSLCGMPFLSGFYSKDLILDMFMMTNYNYLIMIMLFTSMGLTLMYTLRLMYYSFIKNPTLVEYSSYTSYSQLMGISMIMLFMLSVMCGSMISWILFSGSKVFLPLYMKLMIYYYLFLGWFLGFMLMNVFMMLNNMYNNFLFKFFKNLWFMPLLYGSVIPNVYKFSNKIYMVEITWLEYIMGMSFMGVLKMIFKADFINKNYLYLLIFVMISVIMMIM